MSLRCRLGWHDWRSQQEGFYWRARVSRTGLRYQQTFWYEDKLCLRCGATTRWQGPMDRVRREMPDDQ